MPHPDSALIDQLGGPGPLAKTFGITPQAVSQWRNKGIPRPNRMYLQLAHPNVFSAAGGQQDNPSPPHGPTAPPPAEQLVGDAAAGQAREVAHAEAGNA